MVVIAQNRKIGINFISYAQNRKIGINFIRYDQNRKIGINFIRYAQNRKIGKRSYSKIVKVKKKYEKKTYKVVETISPILTKLTFLHNVIFIETKVILHQACATLVCLDIHFIRFLFIFFLTFTIFE
jgi:hypothetical protein